MARGRVDRQTPHNARLPLCGFVWSRRPPENLKANPVAVWAVDPVSLESVVAMAKHAASMQIDCREQENRPPGFGPEMAATADEMELNSSLTKARARWHGRRSRKAGGMGIAEARLDLTDENAKHAERGMQLREERRGWGLDGRGTSEV